MLHRYCIALLLAYALGWSTARAQVLGYANNWFFGNNGGLSFASGQPLPLSGSQMTVFEGCASISDAAGVLQCYTNGVNVWNRNHQFMANGTGLGGHDSSTQGVMLLPAPGSASQYFLFTLDAVETSLVGGLRYSVIDASRQGGLGEVTLKGVRLPTPTVGGSVTEKLTATRHANGRDFWIVVHGWQNADFYAFQLSPSGLSAPVTSTVGPMVGNPGAAGLGNAIGGMRASSDGRWLAMSQYGSAACDLFSFDNATGRVSNHLVLGTLNSVYGVEFSPNSERLYFSASPGNNVVQFNLAAGSGPQIAASRVSIATTDVSTLQLGPDGKIYGAMLGWTTLSVIDNPNALGAACAFRPVAVPISGMCRGGLPNVPYAALRLAAPTVSILPAQGCAALSVALSSQATNVPAGSSYTWNFGDPASGGANTATGPAASHAFSAPGTYTVTLQVVVPGLPPIVATQTVVVHAGPALSLGRADTATCFEQPLLLRPVAPLPAGTTYRWQDGSTGASFVARAPGSYAVEATLNGCSSRAEIRVRSSCEVLIPNVITPNNDRQNDYFVLKGLMAPDWSLQVYNRWGRRIYQAASYQNEWAAAGQPAGVYYYLLRHAANGQVYRGTVEVMR